MTKKIAEKSIKLSLEFDRYLNKHPGLYREIPRGSCVVMTVKGDEKFNKETAKSALSCRHGKLVEARKEDGRWTIHRTR